MRQSKFVPNGIYTSVIDGLMGRVHRKKPTVFKKQMNVENVGGTLYKEREKLGEMNPPH